MVLNVEQYEYMRGPQNDAGIKVNIMRIILYSRGLFTRTITVSVAVTVPVTVTVKFTLCEW